MLVATQCPSLRSLQIVFSTPDSLPPISVFTTRCDTLMGVTCVSLAPEHPLVSDLTAADQQKEVEAYVAETSSRSDMDRTSNKEKTGVFTGSYCVHPLTGESVPIWVADYVLGSYGSGAVMAVPAHDERDYEVRRGAKRRAIVMHIILTRVLGSSPKNSTSK